MLAQTGSFTSASTEARGAAERGQAVQACQLGGANLGGAKLPADGRTQGRCNGPALSLSFHFKLGGETHASLLATYLPNTHL